MLALFYYLFSGLLVSFSFTTLSAMKPTHLLNQSQENEWNYSYTLLKNDLLTNKFDEFAHHIETMWAAETETKRISILMPLLLNLIAYFTPFSQEFTQEQIRTAFSNQYLKDFACKKITFGKNNQEKFLLDFISGKPFAISNDDLWFFTKEGYLCDSPPLKERIHALLFQKHGRQRDFFF